MSLLNIFDISGSALIAQSCRLNVSASNMANAESLSNNGNPYSSKQVVFKLNTNFAQEIGGVKVKKIIEDKTPWKILYDPGNPLADSKGYVKSSNVNMISEMINTISSSRSYQANVEVINTARSMILKTLTLGQ
ncbi:flgC [Wigglesworthia glossinidia endosymbiont of Glossina brevipalpis]|uniref:Flagellar basal-body rod protein FlgC n=1 Tax=Wigglesworthia glossinidia brevipalpis TaxID=36870 RepID=Q8D3G2_WIGBR|nr:flgC [Wigglesworthia glossinidia endosymbiont of Glossina brevipalpis]